MNAVPRQWVTTLVILLVLVGLGAAAGKFAQDTAPSANTVQQTPETITYQGQDGKTVLELLKATHQVETIDQGSAGTYIKSIDGVAQSGNSYWLYYVDGQIGEVGVDKATTTNGQIIQWRYETF